MEALTADEETMEDVYMLTNEMKGCLLDSGRSLEQFVYISQLGNGS